MTVPMLAKCDGPRGLQLKVEPLGTAPVLTWTHT